jgi:hypothetical protein
MHISKSEAQTEALRLAESFVAATIGEDRSWSWECCPPQPDVLSAGYKRRKTVIKWSVAVRLTRHGAVVDGGPIVLVDIETKEARFL